MQITLIDATSGAQATPATQAQLDAAIAMGDSVLVDGVLATVGNSGGKWFLNGKPTSSFFGTGPTTTTPMTPGEILVSGTQPTDVMTDGGFPQMKPPTQMSTGMLLAIAAVVLLFVMD